MIDFKNRLHQLQNKFKGNTKQSIQLVKQFANKYKKTVAVSICIATLLTTGVDNDRVKAENITKLDLTTIYHVYVEGDQVGVVDEMTSVDKLMVQIINKHQVDYEDIELVVGEAVTLIPEVVFNSRANTASTLAKLENRLNIKAISVALIVDGKEVGYVSTEKNSQEVIKNLKLQYVSEDELAKFLKAKEDNLPFGEPSIGRKKIVDLKLSKEIETAKVSVNPEAVLSIERAIKQLNLGTLEDNIYHVEQGDVLGTIAEAHELSTEEILALNPAITENTLLQIGVELNVTVYEPIVTVIVEEAAKIQEEILFQTETKDDPDMWRGDTKVQQEGQKGERVVSYSITRENGRIIDKKIVSEEIIKEPVTRVVLKGTKVTPSRGTGQLSWPAVGGYISSYQGSRWGKFHRGIDIARPRNLNILAADNGTVSFSGNDGGYGNKVMIDHNNGMTTLYAHLASIDVSVGQTVAQGHKIGVMGTTGNSTGIHLHFEVYQNGTLKDPMNYLNN
jgi:murein DD-endopeptidase MepM/ murein hydrolase activator NlpD